MRPWHYILFILVAFSALLATLAPQLRSAQQPRPLSGKNHFKFKTHAESLDGILPGVFDETPDKFSPGEAATAGLRVRAMEATLNDLKFLPEFLERGDGSGEETLERLTGSFLRDRDGTLQWIISNLEGEARRRALAEVFGIWAAASPESALSWLERQDTTQSWEEPVSTSLAALAHRNAPAAAAWLEQNPDYASRDNLEILISVWGDTNPDRAMAWVADRLDSPMRTALGAHLLASLRTDAAAAAILAEMPPDKKDSALAEASRSIAQVDARFAMKLAQLIQSPSVRQSLESSVGADVDALHPGPTGGSR